MANIKTVKFYFSTMEADRLAQMGYNIKLGVSLLN